MASKPSIKRNFVYNIINKLVAVLIPILITPYLARVLEADGTGVLSYVASISSYFILVANIGIETYGQRVIAIHRDDKQYLKRFFVEIVVLRTVLTAACLIIYYFCFVGWYVNKVNNVLYAIYALSILAVAFDFTWFFQGVENFGVLVITGVFTKIAYIVLVFVFVKQKSDINIAAILSVATTAAAYVISLPVVFKYIGGKIGKIRPFAHLKECFVYFIPAIAVQIYTVLDKTMIGAITHSDFENGYYEQADKLVKLPLTVITSLFIIMRSRISYYYDQKRFDDIKTLISKSINVACAFAFPMMLGIVAIAPSLVTVYLGGGYEKCVSLLYILSPLIPIISISNLLGTHFYTPFDRQRVSNVFLIVGAVINLALNSFMIYFWQSEGAAIASIIAETVILILYVYFARSFVSVKQIFVNGYKYALAAVLMFVPVYFMDMYLPTNVWYLILEIASGMIIYAALLLILRVRFVYDYLRYYKNKIFGRSSRNVDGAEQVDADLSPEPESVDDDFVVSDKRRAVWRVELDMVKAFIQICERNGLKYFASGGTLIGAIRHNGFIPWDDDIDLMMPREDYEKFLMIAQSDLPDNMFLQYNGTEKGYSCGHAQIRDNDTACLLRSVDYPNLKVGKNCGIFIDIFPYDNVPDDFVKREEHAYKVRSLKRIVNCKTVKENCGFVKKTAKRIVGGIYFMFHDLEKTIRKIDDVSKRYNGKTNTVALVSFAPGYEKEVWDKSLFDESIRCKFEDIEISVPKHYDEVLRKEFGDYMQIPKDKNNGSMHGQSFFDVERSYKEYSQISSEQYAALFDNAGNL